MKRHIAFMAERMAYLLEAQWNGDLRNDLAPIMPTFQDVAAERCSMPYRPPELFNVNSRCDIDERTDIWVNFSSSCRIQKKEQKSLFLRCRWEMADIGA
jgi:hypothetical protein